MELVIYKDFLFGDYYFLYKDLGDDIYTVGYPELYAKIEALKNDQLPGYSWQTALGENKYPFWLEPVAIAITFLLFKHDIAASFIWIQLCYTFFAGFFLFVFFRKSEIHALAAAAGGILYAFSGYMLGCSTWYLLQFSNDTMLFALFLLSLHYFLQNKKIYLLPIATALIAIAYTSILLYFAFLLVLIYLLLNHQEINSLKILVGQLIRLGFAGLLGLGLASFSLLSNLNQMLNSPRGSGMYPIIAQLKQTPLQFANKTEASTALLRLFSNNLQGIAENFQGWTNYFEAPFWYSGLLVLLLIPQLFHFLSKRDRFICAGILGFFMLVAAVPLFRHTIWIFTGDYYRMIGMLATITFIYFATKALNGMVQQQKVYLKTLLFSFFGLLALLFVLKGAMSPDASPSVYTIVFFLMGYLALLYFFGKRRLSTYFPPALLGFVCLEMIVFATPTLQERKIVTKDDLKTGKGYFDPTQKIIAEIKERDTSFFRLEKDYFSGNSRIFSYNESQIQGFYSSSGYWAFHNPNYIRFLKSIGALYFEGEIGSRFVKGIREIPQAMRLCGVKYFISKQDTIEKYESNFEWLKEQNGHSLFQLKNHMPLGFTFNHYITETDFDKLSLANKHQLLTKAVVVGTSFAKQLNRLRRVSTGDSLKTVHANFKLQSFKENEIKGNIALSQTEVLFFSIPVDEGWKVSVDGRNAEISPVFGGLMGILLHPGNHHIELRFTDSYQKIGFIVTLTTLVLLLLGLIGRSVLVKKKTT